MKRIDKNTCEGYGPDPNSPTPRHLKVAVTVLLKKGMKLTLHGDRLYCQTPKLRVWREFARVKEVASK